MKVQELINKLQNCNPNDEIEIITVGSIKLELRTTRTELDIKDDNIIDITKEIIAVFYHGHEVFRDIVIYDTGEIVGTKEQK